MKNYLSWMCSLVGRVKCLFTTHHWGKRNREKYVRSFTTQCERCGLIGTQDDNGTTRYFRSQIDGFGCWDEVHPLRITPPASHS